MCGWRPPMMCSGRVVRQNAGGADRAVRGHGTVELGFGPARFPSSSRARLSFRTRFQRENAEAWFPHVWSGPTSAYPRMFPRDSRSALFLRRGPCPVSRRSRPRSYGPVRCSRALPERLRSRAVFSRDSRALRRAVSAWSVSAARGAKACAPSCTAQREL